MLPDPCRLGDACREEQSPSQLQRRTRRHRTIFTEEQLDALEELFLQNQYPDVNTREKLAQRTHLREERVEVRLLDHSELRSHDYCVIAEVKGLIMSFKLLQARAVLCQR